jgi:hypothetical protein
VRCEEKAETEKESERAKVSVQITNCKRKEPFLTPANCGRSSISTTSSNKITASSNDG